jgi:nucleoside-diphosphate-sugar epimerase
MSTLTGARVLVTGATGSIGGRLVEYLVQREGADVRALVRTFANAPRIARFPVDMVAGDIRSAAQVDAAVAGCDVVFHCAFGTAGDDDARRAVTTEGTRHVLEAALRHRCRRVVHVSTTSVYGDPPDGEITERSPRRRTGLAYGDSKIDAEALVAAYAERGLSTAIVQPTVVYGPFALTWTVKPLQLLSTGRFILVDGGAGVCQPVYIDDVVEAMIAAATHPAAHNETFLVAGDRPVTWREFYGCYEEMLGQTATVAMSADEARAHYQSTLPRLVPDTWRVLQRETRKRGDVLRERLAPSMAGRLALAAAAAVNLLPARDESGPADPRPIHPLPPAKIPTYTSQARVRIDKLVETLGCPPAHDFAAGMAMTKAWARWANLATSQ